MTDCSEKPDPPAAGNANQKGRQACHILKKEKPLQNLKRLSSFNIW
jgi:hypothetical protein